MLIKKLAAPLINEKILGQAEHVYVATAGISEPAFDFVVGRLSVKCKVEMVTGLDALTSPNVLRRIWAQFPDRVAARIYARNFFHPNVYIFDMPYRKAIAFVGSGSFTLEGLKDHEEVFYKITDPKEIENLKSWFIGYYEFAEPLTERIIQEYEWAYPAMKQRDIVSRQEKKQFMELASHAFQWDGIRFKLQYFKKEDYHAFASSKASLQTEEIQAERAAVQNKLLELHALVKNHVAGLKIQRETEPKQIGSLDPLQHADGRLRSLWLSYGDGNDHELLQLQVIIRQKDVGLWLASAPLKQGVEARRYFRDQMKEAGYRANFFKLLAALGAGYWVEVAGDVRAIETFPNDDALWEFTKGDDGRYFTFKIGKNYSPGDPEISAESIVATTVKQFDKLVLLYRQMDDPFG
ncbi:hypothetical protein [Chryseolinea soli]|uniref:Phospholipase D-like domain-containing protein n=1 Tax=Chryseolinea soli TaxID=2321403 RepID=A0A385SMA2_9BACT|nr:hypothetical protein [Chryseolinea soli]AYB31481.1 hypothetical protein D4L85_13235 [Chryseolinea soli]